MRPMLATQGDHVPTGDAWSHEVKWDGVRILARRSSEGTLRLTTRNGNDATLAWPDVCGVGPTGHDLVVDGEIIALGATGRPDFGVLAERMHVRSARTAARLAEAVPATYMVFDILVRDGRDLTSLPLVERREVLADLDLGGWQVPGAYDDGEMLQRATLEQGLEGIVSKRLASSYQPGVRSRDWLKFAHRYRGSYVVGGWRPQEGTSDRLASLLVGERTSDGLLFRGRVGSGIGGVQSRRLAGLLADRVRRTSPFDDEVPAVDARGTTWVDPVLVVEVESHNRPPLTRLRQPAFKGVRADG